MKKKVVVKGMGVITPIGLNVGDFWHGLTRGVRGVELNDYHESMAIKKTMGSDATRIPISSIKSMTGHLLEGAVEMVASICTIQHGIVPPTINFCEPYSEMDLNYIPNEAQVHNVHSVLSNSYGFGGRNASLIVTKWQG